MLWERRNRIFLLGAPLALVPAVAFLPLFAFLLLSPSSGRIPLESAWIFPGLVFLEISGIVLIGFASSRGGLRYVTLLAVAASLLLMMVAAYTGIFFGVFAAPL